MELLMLTADDCPTTALPALALLAHTVYSRAPGTDKIHDADRFDVVLVDERPTTGPAGSVCRLVGAAEIGVAVIAVLTERRLSAVNPAWGVADVLLTNAGPAEIDARLRLAHHHAAPAPIVVGELVIDEQTHTVWLRERTVELRYREFELLTYLARHQGHAFTREYLHHTVWGPTNAAGVRTVDLHVRRIRAKLGPEHEHLIATIRGIGYKFVG